MQKKLYVLVRNELAPGYVAGQVGHATPKYVLEHPEEAQKCAEAPIVVLGVRFPQGIFKWARILRAKGKSLSIWYEPDQEGQPTSLVCYDTGEIFKNLSVYK